MWYDVMSCNVSAVLWCDVMWCSGMYVYIYPYINVYIYIYTFIHIYIYPYIYIHNTHTYMLIAHEFRIPIDPFFLGQVIPPSKFPGKAVIRSEAARRRQIGRGDGLPMVLPTYRPHWVYSLAIYIYMDLMLHYSTALEAVWSVMMKKNNHVEIRAMDHQSIGVQWFYCIICWIWDSR